jgi:2-polyprenyl-3-methyl-5-hydroxy-6-metoxy-1,4-benzoquinol methylase
MFSEIYDFLGGYDGFNSSFSARGKYKGSKDTSKMTYGEFRDPSFTDMVNVLKKYMRLDGTESVMDLGSGMGKVVVALHYSGLFKNVYGVELLEGLYSDSLNLVRDYSKKFNKDVGNIKIFNDDMLNLNYSPYDLIISNTSVDDVLLQNIIAKTNSELKEGAIVVSTISQFADTNLIPIERFRTQFSWGESHINFSIKK